jgi:hypothetical protein
MGRPSPSRCSRPTTSPSRSRSRPRRPDDREQRQHGHNDDPEGGGGPPTRGGGRTWRGLTPSPPPPDIWATGCSSSAAYSLNIRCYWCLAAPGTPGVRWGHHARRHDRNWPCTPPAPLLTCAYVRHPQSAQARVSWSTVPPGTVRQNQSTRGLWISLWKMCSFWPRARRILPMSIPDSTKPDGRTSGFANPYR